MNADFDEYLDYKRNRRDKGFGVNDEPSHDASLDGAVPETVLGTTEQSLGKREPLPDKVSHAEPHSESHFGPLIKPIVYGGMDGLVSVFVGALIAVITGNTIAVVLALTLGKLFAGAFSMGAGEFMSSKAEVDYATGERKREEWECENFIQGEKAEMVELYEAKGYSKATATRIVDILAKDHKLFVNAMMVEELEIPPEQEEQSPVKNAGVNFSSFMVFGSVPLLPFVVFMIGRSVTCSGATCVGSTWDSTFVPLYISIGLTVLGILLLGVLKSKVTGIKLWLALTHSFIGTFLSVGFGAGLAYAMFYAVGESV